MTLLCARTQLLRLFCCLLVWGLKPPAGQAQLAPTVQWDRTYGGNADDDLTNVVPTADGGYLLGGWSRSGASGDKTRPNAGRTAYWVVKVDSSGAKQWERSFGTASLDDEVLTRVVQTADGGYLLAGGAYAGAWGDKTHPGWGSLDYWVLKLDAQGNKLWDRAYGGSDGDGLSDMVLTSDGGFVLVGSSASNVSGDKTQPCRGIFDLWIIKLDAAGNKQWDRTLGGSGNDGAGALVLTSDGGYLIGGVSNSGVSGEKSQPFLGGWHDCWLVKLDAQGQLQWDRTFGGPGEDGMSAIRLTADGGYMLAGGSNSGVSPDKTQPSRGLYDIWVLKLDAMGRKQWDATIGGSGNDYARDLHVTAAGEYVVGGNSESGISGERTRANYGGSDGWVVQLDAGGRVVWDQAVGGSGSEGITRLLPLRDGGYLLSASSTSGVSGNKTQPNRGGYDYWLVRLQPAHITGDARLCTGGQLQLTAPAGGQAYQWNTGASGSSITVNQPGLYTVAVTGANGATTTLRHQVQAFTPPPLAVSGDSLLCAGRGGQLTVVAPGATGYAWSTGARAASTPVSQPGTYTVAVAFGSGCTQQGRVRVRALPALPALTLGRDTSICEGETVLLQAPATPGMAPSYRWSDGSTGTTLRVQAGGTYSLRVSTACETRTLARNIATAPCLTLPNVITPNGDRFNDRWAVQGLLGEGWALEIFDRWGRKVFQTANYANEWGENANAGSYFYLLRRATTQTTYKGWVEVIR